VSEPWITLLLVAVAYIASIPWSILAHRRLSRQRPATVADDTDASTALVAELERTLG